MSTKPLITVIIPCYNAERYISEAIQSVLEQTVRSFEIVVIDDGSQDGSAAVLHRFPTVRYQYQENGGISAARNHGIKLAKGAFFAFLDADDLWEPYKLQRQIDAFRQDLELDLVFGHVQQFHNDDTRIESTPFEEGPRPGYIPSTLMVRRESFLRVGLFESRWKMGEFADWYVRAQELGLKKMMLPEIVARRRVHDANNGLRQRDSIHDYLHILKDSLDRRRGTNSQRSSDH